MQFANNRKKYVGYISVKNGEYFYVEENVRFVKFDKKYNKIFDKLKIQENGDEDVWLFAKNDVIFANFTYISLKKLAFVGNYSSDSSSLNNNINDCAKVDTICVINIFTYWIKSIFIKRTF